MLWQILLMLAASSAGTRDTAPPPVAHVSRGAVVTSGPPRVRVTVPASARYLGADRFLLNGTNDCEMHIFVEADAHRRVRRFYWVHLESILASDPGDRMHYADTDRRARLWGSTVWTSAEPALMTSVPRTGSDTERFRAIVRKAGYAMPEGMATARLVRLLDDPAGTGTGRSEVMMLYGEDLAASGTSFRDVTTDGKPNARWSRLEGPLMQRAAGSFSISAR